MHLAVRRRAAQSRARVDGARFLVLWARAEPQGAGNVLAPSPFRRTVLAPGDTRGDVPPLDPRELHDLSRVPVVPRVLLCDAEAAPRQTSPRLRGEVDRKAVG